MIPYPTELPVDEVKSVINSIKGGSIIDDKVQFAKAVWTLEGYALGRVFGEAPSRFAQSGPPASDEQVVSYLESALEHHENKVPGAVQAMPPIPWGTIAKWALQILITLI
jgi:hypothetical protein